MNFYWKMFEKVVFIFFACFIWNSLKFLTFGHLNVCDLNICLAWEFAGSVLKGFQVSKFQDLDGISEISSGPSRKTSLNRNSEDLSNFSCNSQKLPKIFKIHLQSHSKKSQTYLSQTTKAFYLTRNLLTS